MKKTWMGFGLVFLLVGGSIMNDLLSQQSAHNVRQPVVAGSFYPGDPEELGATVDRLLDKVPATKISEPLIALISPHAGYPYSGPVAAWAYALLKNRSVRRVVVISPCHVEMFRGSSVFKGSGYATPLGVIPVDQDFAEKLAAASPFIEHSDRGHRLGPQGRGEHALEVQLPFLQRVLDDFLLVPVVMGDQDYEACRALAVALAELIDGPETLIVASSDLSHFHSYEEAVEKDQKVLRAIERWDYLTLSRNLDLRVWEACGGGPIVAAMVAAERLGAVQARVLRYANSGDVPPGDKSRVVGYGAVALYGSQGSGKLELDTIQLNEAEKSELLCISKKSVAESVAGNELKWNPGKASANLRREAAVFVTLKKQGQLRGCVGSLIPVKSLGAAVAAAARNAAVNDPRFPPVTSDELRGLRFEISVLSPFRRIRDIQQIEIGKHGLLIEKGRTQGLLLPQVASERNWDRITFLEQVCVKAGLPKQAWKDKETDIFAFSATVFGESH